jgi:hypothetical protein
VSVCVFVCMTCQLTQTCTHLSLSKQELCVCIV